jgi:glycosyltransferase involved in cell wall biosynthesis
MMNHSALEQQPLVSVVTPSYNAMPFIKENIASVRDQDYPHIEHIVIDGGSEDGTREILQECPHLIWISEPDRGQSHALNKGFQRASGEIIGWLNADDTYRPGAILNAVLYFRSHPEADLIYTDVQVIDDNDQPVRLAKAEPFSLERLLVNNIVKQPTVFMRRRVIGHLGGLDERLHYVMDWELWLRAGLAGLMFHYLPNQTLANFRLCPGTKSFEQSPQFNAEWVMVLEQAAKTPGFARIPLATQQEALRKSRAGYHLANMIQAVRRGERRMMLHHLIWAARCDWRLIFNRGVWLYLGQGISGYNFDRLRKRRV